jgi:hypothetical protein
LQSLTRILGLWTHNGIESCSNGIGGTEISTKLVSNLAHFSFKACPHYSKPNFLALPLSICVSNKKQKQEPLWASCLVFDSTSVTLVEFESWVKFMSIYPIIDQNGCNAHSQLLKWLSPTRIVWEAVFFIVTKMVGASHFAWCHQIGRGTACAQRYWSLGTHALITMSMLYYLTTATTWTII